MHENRAVIFDIDGVLVDSYQAHFLSWQQLAECYGRSCSDQEFAAGFGRTTREVLLDQWSDFALDETRIRQLDEQKETLYRQIIAADFPAMPGSRELILQLFSAGWKLALGSSGPRENVDLAIEKLNISQQIQAAISGNDVLKGKPHPDVFLTAAEQLELLPSQCIVIEDASAGVEAAHSAGMKCIGFTSTGRTAAELSQADLIVNSLYEIKETMLLDLLAGS